MGTEANWLPLCSKTYFSDRLLLSMNSLQFLGSYCGTPSLSRSCAISAKSFTVEKKRRYSWCLLWKKLMRALSERRFFFPSIWMSTFQQSLLTMSYRTTWWLKIRILEAAPVLSVDPSHINSAEVAKFRLLLPLVHPRSACLAPHVWRPSFILVSKFNTKISMVIMRYETCWLASYQEQWCILHMCSRTHWAYFCMIFWPKPSHSPEKQK